MNDQNENLNPQPEQEPMTEPTQSAQPQAGQSTTYSSYTTDGEYAGAGVGERTTVNPPANGDAYRTDTQNTQTSYTGTYQPPTPEAPKKPKKAKRSGGPSAGGVALLLIVCLLLGAGSGFGGAYLYGQYFAPDTETSIKTSGKGGKSDVVVNTVDPSNTIALEEGSPAAVIAQVADTVVEIRTEAVVHGSFFGNYVSEGAGSGVIISEDGYIITNNHVIDGADTITVRTKDGTEYTAKLISTDAQTDIAVIKVDASGLHAATIGVSKNLVVGERAIAIGNPLGELGGSVTLGYISALDREVTIEGTKMTLLQTDAAINPGNSGGGLFNARGDLIGIVNAKSSGDAIEGLGFAIPIDTAFAVATDLIESGHVSGRPMLGIQFVEVNSSNYYQYRTKEISKYIDTFGVYIAEDEQGNFEFGDRIVAIDGTSVSTFNNISEILTNHKIGDTVTVTVSRNRKITEIKVTLIESN